jgi:hypothetical protein
MHSTFFTTLALCFSLLTTTLASPHTHDLTGAVLKVRQSTAPTDPCLDYSITATHAIIGANSSYRAAYFSLSNVGTIYDARMLDAAIAKLPSLTKNQELNSQCGNLTETKLVEAEGNFTKGIVGPFSGVQPLVLTSGPIVAVIVAATIVIFGSTWIFMP